MKLLLASGGLDSITRLHENAKAKEPFQCLAFDYKQRHVQEIQMAKSHCRDLGILLSVMELPALNGLTDKSWIVPFRNPIMLMCAGNKADEIGATEIEICVNADDESYFPDCRGTFIDACNDLISASGYEHIRVIAPYLNLNKKQIAKKAKLLGIKKHQVWTCHRGGAKPCNDCPACKKLNEAFK